MSETILVTGGPGNIGGKLVADGRAVRGMVRDPEKAARLRALGRGGAA